MAEFRLDIKASINGALYIIEKLGRNTDFHELFKILYFADRKHTALYGKPITGDTYTAMNYGPVPSTLYDILKYLRGGSSFFVPRQDSIDLIKLLSVNQYFVASNGRPDMDSLSESAIEILDSSIEANKQKNFNQRTTDSHDAAYDKVNLNDEISYIDMAEAEGITEDMKKYIRSNIENAQIFPQYA